MEYFKLFSNCIITRGFSRSLISDLQRTNSQLVPNSLCEIIEFLSKKNKIALLEVEFGVENIETINEYLIFLVDKNLGFHCDDFDFDNFINLETNFDFPSKISNAIIEYSFLEKKISFENLLESLDNLYCKFLNIFFYDTVNLNILKEICDLINQSKITSYELFLKYSQNHAEILNYFRVNQNKLTKIIFYESKESRMDNYSELIEVIYIERNLSNRNCGIVNSNYFGINMQKFTESLNHNSCLNRKISIDKDGNIKNCPSMPQSFGNIKDTTLEEALNHKDFKKYWNVNKDMIAVCKDCEFRHICTDCRAYTEQTDFEGDIDLSKPLKCGYNPYTNVWEEWSTNPLKQKAIEYYGMQELIKKK